MINAALPVRHYAPPNRRRVSCPSDWGICMTVCVAAVCETSKTIVTASDRLVTWGHTSSESALKLALLQHPFWLTMIAGEDITIGVESVVAAVRDTLSAFEKPPSVSEVQAVLLGAWRDARNQVGAAAVLSPYGLDVPAFVKNGRQYFGESKFFELVIQLEKSSRLSCDLLVCGFDEHNKPSLLVCDDRNGCRNFTRGGYVAIGSGDAEALASMAFHEYDTLCDLNHAIYRVCAAKFMAEKALGVGKETMVLCLRNDGRKKWIFKRAIKPIRALWEKQGRPRIPPETAMAKALTRINEELEWLE